jgi:hypothetical protein
MGGSDVNKIRGATVAARTSADFCHSENAAHGKMSSAIGRKNIVFLTQQKGKLIFDDNGWGSIVTSKTGVPAAGIPVTMAPIPVMPDPPRLKPGLFFLGPSGRWLEHSTLQI